MRTIWKFDIPVNVLTASSTTVKRIPQGAKLLHVREQGSAICMWFEVDPEAPALEHKYQLHPTGGEVRTGLFYIGTGIFAEGSLVLHLYEVVNDG